MVVSEVAKHRFSSMVGVMVTGVGVIPLVLYPLLRGYISLLVRVGNEDTFSIARADGLLQTDVQ